MKFDLKNQNGSGKNENTHLNIYHTNTKRGTCFEILIGKMQVLTFQ